jgi:low molecular weight phosphotyrosine protein phosphatase
VTSDFINFTHILAADETVLEYLEKRKPSTTEAKVVLWGSYLDGKPIPDPYYGKIVSGDCHWFSSLF